MAPLQRVLLDCTYLSLIDAGYDRSEMHGLNCGVFVGNLVSSLTSFHSKQSVYSGTGVSGSIASGRISFVFNFQGPNAAYDTACSSSLVALDAALSALVEEKCELALVAGVNELFDSKVFLSTAGAGMITPTGRCHSFDAAADG